MSQPSQRPKQENATARDNKTFEKPCKMDGPSRSSRQVKIDKALQYTLYATAFDTCRLWQQTLFYDGDCGITIVVC